jgi:hypothetical protein
MTEKESTRNSNSSFPDSELEIEPSERLREFLKIPLRLEHKYLEEDIPSIVKVCQLPNEEDSYKIVDSLGDKYLIRLTLSPEERAYTELHTKEYERNNFLMFKEPNSSFKRREIYRLDVKISSDQGEKTECIEISYRRTENTDSK